MRLDEGVYPRIHDEGAAFAVDLGNDEILRSPAFWKRDVPVDDRARSKQAGYRIAAFVTGKGVAKLRHRRRPYSSR